jgi:nitrogen fixation/metabolism regulation signal transduction histidine kinase
MASQALGQRLMRLADLIEVFGNEVLETGDRIEPLELIREVCAELGPRAEKMGVRFDIVEPRETLPPVYGNRKLIGRAFHECLENALVHSRKEVSSGQLLAVEIRFTLSGEHVLVAVRNRGASTLRIGGQDAPRPFVAPPPGGSDSVPRLGLPLVQRIVSLHGANLRLSAVDEDTTQVLMEFPTGAPLRGQEQLGITQAQRYAKDLAQLMSRRKKEKA